MDNAVEIRGLCKRYRSFALEDVSFDIPRGYVMGLIGPNGAGKTTIIKLLMDLIRADAGEVRLLGERTGRGRALRRSRVGFVYETPCFPDDCTLREIRAAVAPFYPRWDQERFASLVEEFEIPARKRFRKLSHGTQTKLALAVALMAGFGPTVIAAREDKLKTRILTCSLPVERSQAVAARYIGAWLMFAAYVAAALLCLLIAGGPSKVAGAFQLRTAFGMLTAYTLVLALTLPFVERFGFVGVFVFLVGMQFLGLIAMASTLLVPGRSAIGLLFDAVKAFSVGARSRMGLAWYYLAFAAILAAANGASFGISAAIFRRREL